MNASRLKVIIFFWIVGSQQSSTNSNTNSNSNSNSSTDMVLPRVAMDTSQPNPTARPSLDATEEVLSSSLTEALSKVTNANQNIAVVSVEESTVVEEMPNLFEPPIKRSKRASDSLSQELNTSNSSQSEAGDVETIPLTDIMDMDFDGALCVSCGRGKVSGEDNSIIECQECSKHYHQQCHKPPVSTADVNDPRLIWYCTKCTKRHKKEMQSASAPSSRRSTTNASSSNANSDGSSASKKASAAAAAAINPFQQVKRRNITSASADTKTPVSTSAATSAAASSASTSANNERPTSPKQLPQSVIMKSTKRLDMMKKRAKIQQSKKR